MWKVQVRNTIKPAWRFGVSMRGSEMVERKIRQHIDRTAEVILQPKEVWENRQPTFSVYIDGRDEPECCAVLSGRCIYVYRCSERGDILIKRIAL